MYLCLFVYIYTFIFSSWGHFEQIFHVTQECMRNIL